MSFLLRELWTEELIAGDNLRIHPNIFYLENYNFFGIERIGGTFSYLKNTYKENIKSKLGPPFDSQNDDDVESNILTSDVFNYGDSDQISDHITTASYLFIGYDSILV